MPRAARSPSTATKTATRGAHQALGDYRRKRNFANTPEPGGEPHERGGDGALSFVIQKHAASHLHYDFRLELDGTLKSWAVPKGPSFDPHDKRMAVQVEDHPLSYGSFEGTIPPGQYGAGTVIVWDRGTWQPMGDARKGLRDGKIAFELRGEKLHGMWALVRMRGRGDEKKPVWLLIKEKDKHVRDAASYNVVQALPDSVLSGPTKTRPAATAVPPAEARAPASRRAKAPGIAAPLPATLAPQLATLVDAAPEGDDWRYEIKFDGYRLLTRIEGQQVRCFTRNGHDWSHKLPHLVAACRTLGLKKAWLDGEIVVAGADGVPDFQALQNAFDSARTEAIVYCVFDLPHCNGRDLRALPLTQRQAILQQVLADHDATRGDGPLRLSATLEGSATQLLEAAAKAGLEGLIGKRADSPYSSRRSGDWIKLKTSMRQEFVIGGYTDPQGSRAGIGALLLGLHDEQGALHYAGNVGSGFDDRTLVDLARRLAPLERASSPFVDAPARVGTQRKQVPHWVKPTLLAEVSFAQWTKEQRVRHAVFHGLRSDKPARAIGREKPAPVAAVANSKRPAAQRDAAPAISHPERVVDTRSRVRKGDIAAYYARVAPLLLPHLKARPIALLRAPQGVGHTMFFQKHADAGELPHLKLLDPALDPGHEPLMAVPSAEALHTLAQMNVLELHTWGSTTRSIHKPDRIVFDLDPGEGVRWAQVQEAARLLHNFLHELGLTSFLKTSGGKGLHVLVPLKPQHSWNVIKPFSQAVVTHIAQVLPERFVAKSGPKNRVGRIFIDYLRNGFGATTVAAWSLRARPGLGISVPVTWEELDGLRSSDQWTVATLEGRDAIGNMPWAGYEAARQTLGTAMRRLGFKPAAAKKAAAQKKR